MSPEPSEPKVYTIQDGPIPDEADGRLVVVVEARMAIEIGAYLKAVLDALPRPPGSGKLRSDVEEFVWLVRSTDPWHK